MILTVSVAEARDRFSELTAKVAFADQRVIIKRKGKPMMAWISFEDFHRLQKFERAERERDFALILEAAAANDMPEEEAWNLAQRAVDDVRGRRAR